MIETATDANEPHTEPRTVSGEGWETRHCDRYGPGGPPPGRPVAKGERRGEG